MYVRDGAHVANYKLWIGHSLEHIQIERIRITELDSLRGGAALAVVLWHYKAHFGAAPLYQVLAPFYLGGFLFVDFFFVLSGFVLAKTYWTESRRFLIFQNVAERIARLYPLHFVT